MFIIIGFACLFNSIAFLCIQVVSSFFLELGMNPNMNIESFLREFIGCCVLGMHENVINTYIMKDD